MKNVNIILTALVFGILFNFHETQTMDTTNFTNTLEMKLIF